MTEPKPTTPAIIRLSIFLAECRPTELLHILDSFPQGVLTVLESVPMFGETFSVNVTGLNGKATTRVVPEELIRDTPEARQWRDEKAESSRMAIMSSTGEIGTTEDEVKDNPSEFDKLVAIRRAYLKSNKGKAAPTPPKKAAAAAAPAPRNAKPADKNTPAKSPQVAAVAAPIMEAAEA